MKNKACKFLPLVLFALSMNVARAGDEQQERLQIQQSVLDLVYVNNWKKLDNLFSEYINGLPTTSNGAQKLILAYSALTENNTQKPDGGESFANDWLKADPDSSVAIMLKAASFSGKAFFLRGEGSADTVDNDVWPKFKQLIEQEKSYLLKHKDIADINPIWYQLMISVARNLGDKELLIKTLNEGSDKYPTYQNIYIDAMEASLPKWGGSPEAVEKVAQLASSKTASKFGKSYYAYIWYNALAIQPEMMGLLENNKIISWETMKQGWHDRYKQFPGANIATEYMSTACVAHDKSAFAEGYSWINHEYGAFIQRLWLPGTEFNACNSFLESKS